MPALFFVGRGPEEQGASGEAFEAVCAGPAAPYGSSAVQLTEPAGSWNLGGVHQCDPGIAGSIRRQDL